MQSIRMELELSPSFSIQSKAPPLVVVFPNLSSELATSRSTNVLILNIHSLYRHNAVFHGHRFRGCSCRDCCVCKFQRLHATHRMLTPCKASYCHRNG
jgi:hypothetical protein